MDVSEETEVLCPYCGAMFAIEVGTTVARCEMIEDCAVCCRPIRIRVDCEDGMIAGIEADRA